MDPDYQQRAKSPMDVDPLSADEDPVNQQQAKPSMDVDTDNKQQAKPSMDDQDDTSIINKMDKNLGRLFQKDGAEMEQFYYEDGVDSQGRFAIQCEDNGYDDEFVDEELKTDDPTENQLIDLFETDDGKLIFPGISGQDEDKQREIILDAIVTASRDSQETPPPPLTDSLFHGIDQNYIDKTVEIYTKQVPSIMDELGAADKTFCHLLAVQRKHRFDFLQFLMSLFTRWCLKMHNRNIRNNPEMNPRDRTTALTEEQWRKATPRLFDGFSKENQDLITGAIKSLFHRIVPRLFFQPVVLIQDYLEVTVEHILNAVNFVKNMVSVEHIESCPTQLDVLIAYPKTRRAPFASSDEKDDDTEPEPLGPFKPSYAFLGNVEERLRGNNLIYAKYSPGEKDPFGVMYRKLQAKVTDKIADFSPRNRRLCVFIDRGVRFHKTMEHKKVAAASGQKDEALMFLPPVKLGLIPNDAEPEWYFHSSKECIIPATVMEEEQKQPADETDPRRLKVTSDTAMPEGVEGQTITLSFHIKSRDCIRVFLYVNGQITRFFPEDITELLPHFFDMDGKTEEGDWRQNKVFLEQEKKDHRYQIQMRLQDSSKFKLPDVRYDIFRKAISAH